MAITVTPPTTTEVTAIGATPIVTATSHCLHPCHMRAAPTSSEPKKEKTEKMETNRELENMQKKRKERGRSSTSRPPSLHRLTPSHHRGFTPPVAFLWPQCRSTTPQQQKSRIPRISKQLMGGWE
ncbi:hypothetical protein SESBI_22481 [Sesbania bispinosa]|nr:hypothetical protein SESBI_22481 [Sesbania bispinosa]